MPNHSDEESNHCPGLLITGTDTDVGKTRLASLLAKELINKGSRTGVYKPACSGAIMDNQQNPQWEDVDQLWEATGRRYEKARISPQRFLAPVAPPVSARLEQKTVDPDLVVSGFQWWQDKVDFLLVEGVGGLLCPLTEKETIADFAQKIKYPVIIVARLGLGTINHTLMTIETAHSRGLSVAGIILNETDPETSDLSQKTNPEEIAKRTQVPLLGILRWNGTELLSPKGREPARIDWFQLGKSPG